MNKSNYFATKIIKSFAKRTFFAQKNDRAKASPKESG